MAFSEGVSTPAASGVEIVGAGPHLEPDLVIGLGVEDHGVAQGSRIAEHGVSEPRFPEPPTVISASRQILTVEVGELGGAQTASGQPLERIDIAELAVAVVGRFGNRWLPVGR